MAVRYNHNDVDEMAVEPDAEPDEFEPAFLPEDEEIIAKIGAGSDRQHCFLCEWEEHKEDYYILDTSVQKFYNIIASGTDGSSSLDLSCIKAAAHFNQHIATYVNSRLDLLNQGREVIGAAPFKKYKMIEGGDVRNHQRSHVKDTRMILCDAIEHLSSITKHIRNEHILKRKKGSAEIIIDYAAAKLFKEYSSLLNDSIKTQHAIKMNKKA